MLHLKGRLRSLLRRAGKGDKKVAAVFGASAAACHQAVLHLREGAPEVPIWLFTTVEPQPVTAALCERVVRSTNALALAGDAQAQLWRCWVAITVGAWTGERGAWPLKLAPFLVPPFRVLILNRDGGLFPWKSLEYISSLQAPRQPRCCHRDLAWANTREVVHSAGDGSVSALVRCRDVEAAGFAN